MNPDIVIQTKQREASPQATSLNLLQKSSILSQDCQLNSQIHIIDNSISVIASSSMNTQLSPRSIQFYRSQNGSNQSKSNSATPKKMSIAERQNKFKIKRKKKKQSRFAKSNSPINDNAQNRNQQGLIDQDQSCQPMVSADFQGRKLNNYMKSEKKQNIQQQIDPPKEKNKFGFLFQTQPMELQHLQHNNGARPCTAAQSSRVEQQNVAAAVQVYKVNEKIYQQQFKVKRIMSPQTNCRHKQTMFNNINNVNSIPSRPDSSQQNGGREGEIGGDNYSYKNVEGMATVDPRVFEPFKRQQGKVPRNVLIERKKKEFFSADLTQLLESKKKFTSQRDYSLPKWLPLQYFDYSCKQDLSNEEWIAQKVDAEGKPRILTGQGIHLESCSKRLEWFPIFVESYDKMQELFTVRRLENGERQQELVLPRVQICFHSENPETYIIRFAKALKARDRAYAKIIYSYIVDCIPTDDLADIDPVMHQNIECKLASFKPIKAIDTTLLMMEVEHQFKSVSALILFNQHITELYNKLEHQQGSEADLIKERQGQEQDIRCAQDTYPRQSPGVVNSLPGINMVNYDLQQFSPSQQQYNDFSFMQKRTRMLTPPTSQILELTKPMVSNIDSCALLTNDMIKQFYKELQRQERKRNKVPYIQLLDTASMHGEKLVWMHNPQEIFQEKPASFFETFKQFCHQTLLQSRESIMVLQKLQQESLKLLEVKIFNLNRDYCLMIDQFKNIQESQLMTFIYQIKDVSLAELQIAIKTNFAKVEKGWFNMKSQDKFNYSSGKLRRLFSLMRIKIQDLLHMILNREIRNFVQFFQELSPSINQIDQFQAYFNEIVAQIHSTHELKSQRSLNTAEELEESPINNKRNHICYDIVEDYIGENSPLVKSPLQFQQPMDFLKNLFQSYFPHLNNRPILKQALRKNADSTDFVYSLEPEKLTKQILQILESAILELQKIPDVEQETLPHIFNHLRQVQCYRASLATDQAQIEASNEEMLTNSAIIQNNEQFLKLKQIMQISEKLQHLFIAVFKKQYMKYLVMDPEKKIQDYEIKAVSHQNLQGRDGGGEKDENSQRREFNTATTHSSSYLTNYQKLSQRHRNEINYLKGKVNKVKREEDYLSQSLPQFAAYGVVSIDLAEIKTLMIEKQQSLGRKILELMASISMVDILSINEQFQKICEELKKVPCKMEEVTQMKEYLEKVLVDVELMHADVQENLQVIGSMDEFQYKFSKEDIESQLFTLGYRREILEIVSAKKKELMKIKFKMMEQHTLDVEAFSSTIENYDMTIKTFHMNNDLKYYADVFGQCQEMNKSLLQFMEMAKVFNKKDAFFEKQLQDYSKVHTMIREFQPYYLLWKIASQWMDNRHNWQKGPIATIDTDFMSMFVEDSLKQLAAVIRIFSQQGLHLIVGMAQELMQEIQAFKPKAPLLLAFSKKGFKECHWKMLSERVGFEVKQSLIPTLEHIIALGLERFTTQCLEVGYFVEKEFQIEQNLIMVENKWDQERFETAPYRLQHIIKNLDELQQALDEDGTHIQMMLYSPYRLTFQTRINEMFENIRVAAEVLEETRKCQVRWLYLKPLFEIQDFSDQLPNEAKRFAMCDIIWRYLISNARVMMNNVMRTCLLNDIKEKLAEANYNMDVIKKEISKLLDRKREQFPRFFFMGNDDMLIILSKQQDLHEMQPYFSKIIENVKWVQLTDSLGHTSNAGNNSGNSSNLSKSGNYQQQQNLMQYQIQALVSDDYNNGNKVGDDTGGGNVNSNEEKLFLQKKVDTYKKLLEKWMKELVESMQESLRISINSALLEYTSYYKSVIKEQSFNYQIADDEKCIENINTMQATDEPYTFPNEYSYNIKVSESTNSPIKLDNVGDNGAKPEENKGIQDRKARFLKLPLTTAHKKDSCEVISNNKQVEQIRKVSGPPLISESKSRYDEIGIGQQQQTAIRQQLLLKWVASHCSQSVLTVNQIIFAQDVEEALIRKGNDGYSELHRCKSELSQNLEDLVQLIRDAQSKQKNFSPVIYTTINSLIVQLVSARDVVDSLLSLHSSASAESFEWQATIRYYLREEVLDRSTVYNCYVHCMQTVVPYEYEYLGAVQRLVITPLIIKCQLTMLCAYKLNLGGAPSGPAGTGKTESVKDLTRAVGKQSIIFNCSEEMDHHILQQFFKGLISTGAWCCFDEFNRISLEVLSVAVTLISSIYNEKAKFFQTTVPEEKFSTSTSIVRKSSLINGSAHFPPKLSKQKQQQQYKVSLHQQGQNDGVSINQNNVTAQQGLNPYRVQFENSSLEFRSTFSVFITINPGYAGRTELPDNLKSLFRPTAMFLPDFQEIAEILLYSQGFLKGRDLAKKLIESQKMAQQMLSLQTHYDYGLRQLKSTLICAGHKKQSNPQMDEQQLLFQAMMDTNLPKFLPDDLLLYKFILKDLFPKILEKDQLSKEPIHLNTLSRQQQLQQSQRQASRDNKQIQQQRLQPISMQQQTQRQRNHEATDSGTTGNGAMGSDSISLENSSKQLINTPATQMILPASSPENQILEKRIKQSCSALYMVASPHFVAKIIQLNTVLQIRHGVMVIGGSGRGKSAVLKTLLRSLNWQGDISSKHMLDSSMGAAGDNMKKKQSLKMQDKKFNSKVKATYINPKSVTIDQLYGYYNQHSQEWHNGILAQAMTEYCQKNRTDERSHKIVEALASISSNAVIDSNKAIDSNGTLETSPALDLSSSPLNQNTNHNDSASLIIKPQMDSEKKIQLQLKKKLLLQQGKAMGGDHISGVNPVVKGKSSGNSEKITVHKELNNAWSSNRLMQIISDHALLFKHDQFQGYYQNALAAQNPKQRQLHANLLQKSLQTINQGTYDSQHQNGEMDWIVLDGPIDTAWIESLNSVLDDSKRLCLNSGSVLILTPFVRLIFEVEDLQAATPATISRCGMVYLSEDVLTTQVLIESWFSRLPDNFKSQQVNIKRLRFLFGEFVEPSLQFMKDQLGRASSSSQVEIVGSEINKVTSLLRFLDCLLGEYYDNDYVKASPDSLKDLVNHLDQIFVFALTWSIGCTCISQEDRNKFDQFIKSKLVFCLKNPPQNFFSGQQRDKEDEDSSQASKVPKMRQSQKRQGLINALDTIPAMALGQDLQSDTIFDYMFDQEQKCFVKWDDVQQSLQNKCDSPTSGGGGLSPRLSHSSLTGQSSMSEIFFPTKDTVRNQFWRQTLTVNGCQIVCVGPAGIGKSTNILNLLQGGGLDKQRYQYFGMSFSGQTMAGHVQDVVESKLVKMRRGVYATTRSGSMKCIFYIENVNLAKPDLYGSRSAIELLRQFLDYKGFYNRKEVATFMRIENLQLICEIMWRPGFFGNKDNCLSRLLRHFNILFETDLTKETMTMIYKQILNRQLIRYSVEVKQMIPALISATLDLFHNVREQLKPTPQKLHYTFSYQDVQQIFQGICASQARIINTQEQMLRLWRNENMRQVYDRLSTDQDRKVFLEILQFQQNFLSGGQSVGKGEDKALGETLSPEQKGVSKGNEKLKLDSNSEDLNPLIYCDFLNGRTAEPRFYQQVTDINMLMQRMEAFQDEYNEDSTFTFLGSKEQLHLIFFQEACEAVAKIARSLRQPGGCVLLIGMGGVGKQSLSKMAIFLNNQKVLLPEISHETTIIHWREKLKQFLLHAGMHGKSITMLFEDGKCVQEEMLQDISSILTSGDIPGLYTEKDYDDMMSVCKQEGSNAELSNKVNVAQIFMKRVKRFTHFVLSLSPLQKNYTNRMRMFPAMVNKCTPIWMGEWPQEALLRVAHSQLYEFFGAQQLPLPAPLQQVSLQPSQSPLYIQNSSLALAQFCTYAHLSAIQNAREQNRSTRFEYTVVPSQFIQLLLTIRSIFTKRLTRLQMKQQRLFNGLKQIQSAKAQVSEIGQYLQEMYPQLRTAQEQIDSLLNKLKKDKEEAGQQQSIVQKEEATATIEENETRSLASQAQSAVAQVNKQLEQCLQEVHKIKKEHLIEIKSLGQPPLALQLVLICLAIIFQDHIIKHYQLMGFGQQPGNSGVQTTSRGSVLMQFAPSLHQSQNQFPNTNTSQSQNQQHRESIALPQPNGSQLMQQVIQQELSNKDKKKELVDENQVLFELAKKHLLNDTRELLSLLKNFDRCGITQLQIKQMEDKATGHPEFSQQAAERCSFAAKFLFQWVKGMIDYTYIYQSTRPLREKLADMKQRLALKTQALNNKKQQLSQITTTIEELEHAYLEKLTVKEDLVARINDCAKKLKRAEKITNGLKNEQKRWANTVELINMQQHQLLVQSVITAAEINYFGPFFAKQRCALESQWIQYTHSLGYSDQDLACGGEEDDDEQDIDEELSDQETKDLVMASNKDSKECKNQQQNQTCHENTGQTSSSQSKQGPTSLGQSKQVQGSLGHSFLNTFFNDRIQFQQWQILGLPQDQVSLQNTLMMENSIKWPVFIDPQGQYNNFLKKLGKTNQQGFEVIKMKSQNLHKTLELAIQYGLWVIVENFDSDFDPFLDPILQKDVRYITAATAVSKEKKDNKNDTYFSASQLDIVKVQNISQISASKAPQTHQQQQQKKKKNIEDQSKEVSDKDSISTKLDEPNLEKQLQQQTKKVLFIGEKMLSYCDDFRLFFTTYNDRPDFDPVIFSKTLVIYSGITISQLEEQMLALILSLENPELEFKRMQILTQSSEDARQLQSLEDQTLLMLTQTDTISDLLNDDKMVTQLANAKAAQNNYGRRIAEGVHHENDIQQKRETYRNLATHVSNIFFAILDLSVADPMYQYSLSWYFSLFKRCQEMDLEEERKQQQYERSQVDEEIISSSDEEEDPNVDSGDERELQLTELKNKEQESQGDKIQIKQQDAALSLVKKKEVPQLGQLKSNKYVQKFKNRERTENTTNAGSAPQDVNILLKVLKFTNKYTPAKRLNLIKDVFTKLVHESVCGSIFAKHRVLFSFLLSMRQIEQNDEEEYRFLLSGSLEDVNTLESCPCSWIPQNSWTGLFRQLSGLNKLPAFKGIKDDFMKNSEQFRLLSNYREQHHVKQANHKTNPHVQFEGDSANDNELQLQKQQLNKKQMNYPQFYIPKRWKKKLNQFRQLLLIRVFRPEKIVKGILHFINKVIGPEFAQFPEFNINRSYLETDCNTPLLFIIAPGSDPKIEIMKFAALKKQDKNLRVISLGQGQGAKAEKILKEAMIKGFYVLLENCHLAQHWLKKLEQIYEQICDQRDGNKASHGQRGEMNNPGINQNFRLWLTSQSFSSFSLFLLQNCVKITFEESDNVKQHLHRCYQNITEEDITTQQIHQNSVQLARLLCGLSFFHAFVMARKRYGALGWNAMYEFTLEDFIVSKKEIKQLLEQQSAVPYQAINSLITKIYYGGRVTDQNDQRLINVIIQNIFNEKVLNQKYVLNKAGDYFIDDLSLAEQRKSIQDLSQLTMPEDLGFTSNANFVIEESEVKYLFDTLLTIQLKGVQQLNTKFKEGTILNSINYFQEKLPTIFDIQTLAKHFSIDYSESLNYVLVQELIKFNVLIERMRESLQFLKKSLLGDLIISEEQDQFAQSLFQNIVPSMWLVVSFSTLKPLVSWFSELLVRHQFFFQWSQKGKPNSFLLSSFYYPQAFITGVVQNYARKNQNSINQINIRFQVRDQLSLEKIDRPAPEGCYIYGLFMQCAKWNTEQHSIQLAEEIFYQLPIMQMIPQEITAHSYEAIPGQGQYECPLYKLVSRQGVLSQIGLSSNFVIYIQLPVREEINLFIKAGVAAFLSLNA